MKPGGWFSLTITYIYCNPSIATIIIIINEYVVSVSSSHVSIAIGRNASLLSKLYRKLMAIIILARCEKIH